MVLEPATGMSVSKYQYGWWINEPRGGSGYSAEGDLGQFMCVFPDADLVIARFGITAGGIYWTRLLSEIASWIDLRLSDEESNNEIS